MIQLSDLTKSFGDRVLFDHVTWQITDRERVGLCGPNGAGKTTLLKMMAGLDEPDSGAILKPSALTVGYLPQDGLTHAGPHGVRRSGERLRARCSAMKAEMHALEDRLGDAVDPRGRARRDARTATATCRIASALHDGYSIELKTATVLQGLGFKTADFERPTETFSGGWQMRIALAKLLLGAARTCCCSTSRPTTSTSRRATGSRSTSTPIRTPSSSSRTTASSSTPSSRASPTSRCAR